ncbi:hypothetical protein HHK36_027227 [Tetracentron sinense]|uniref:Uncharacterized protein n=1 Tax=Tetracentron sinense TaxID=13715 RepID=A0A834YMA2_TETSI|nr:hypothetical protein HHK36_027227 [Tetracentron sinense]
MTILNGSLVPSLSTTWFLPKVSPTLSTNSEVMFLIMITEERFQLIHGTIDDKHCKSENTSNTEYLNINFRKLEALISEEEAFQSPSSMTLRFLVSVLLGFQLKVSLTFSTNSEVPGNALHALRSRLSDPTNVLQSWDPILSDLLGFEHRLHGGWIWAVLNIFGTLGSELGELQHLQYFLLINNKLTGSIPKEFTTLSNFKIFDVSNNDICGMIPIDPRNNK